MSLIKGKFEIIIIAAVSENSVIGLNNQLPWDLPEDLKRFKKLTSGHTVIMGRNTYESIGKPLPNRNNIVLSTTLKSNKVKVATCMEDALYSVPQTEEKVFIIGGESVYEEGLLYADKMELTIVPGFFQGDAHFPEFSEKDWAVTKEDDKMDFVFITLERI